MTAWTSSPPKTRTRFAGLFYLAIIILGLTSQLVLRGSMTAFDDVEALRDDALWLRFSIAADSVMVLCDIALAVLLYLLLKHIHGAAALLAMCFRLAQAAMLGAFLPLTAIALMPALAPIAPDIMQIHGLGYDLALIPFGINTLIMGWLLSKTCAPKALTIALYAAGAVYLIGSFSRVLAPELNAVIQPGYLVPIVAESWFCLWLLFGPGISPVPEPA